MDQMEENEIELETVVIDDNVDSTDFNNVPTDTVSAAISVEECNKVEKLVKFPITRIKHLVKMDPDVNLCSQEALFLITKTTEFFVECLSKEAYSYTAQSKKKTVQKKDVEQAIDAVDALAFLEGVLDS
ncbi:putative DNA polymerase epsilon subunit 4 [Daphnia magna]|uniref:Putative DNA polymerase epsilon subunit 4 n=1 Tax=Daphnia magna TaxID=35525 RepID=A0A0P5YHA2_9CRUS|nr:putative DNA polymerase epsilon subunit 4 [Daphnia magna]